MPPVPATQPSASVITTEGDILAWLGSLGDTHEVLLPHHERDGAWRFRPLPAPSPADAGAALSPAGGYHPTQTPPGKVFAPARDVLFTFRTTEDGAFEATPSLDATPRVLAGVRPCDVRAVHLMDAVNTDGHPDPHYLARRRAAVLVGYACPAPCDDRCFCQAVGSLDAREGADVWLTPFGDALLADAHTPRGEALLATLEGRRCEPQSDEATAARAQHRAERPEPFGRQLVGPSEGGEPPAPEEVFTALHAALSETWRSPLWAKHTERCLSCGTCNLVCPTCYCFDTFDEEDVSHPGCGERCRTWDGCMLPQFAEVAGGHSFRKTAAARQRHRVKRKFEYLSARYAGTVHGGSFCVGCGRCGTQCTVDIDIFDIARDLLRTAQGAGDAPNAALSAARAQGGAA